MSVWFERVLVLTLVSCSIRSLLERGYILYTGSYCGSLRGAWQITGSSDSDNRACLSSNVYGWSWKEMSVDDWGLFVWVFVGFVGGSSDVVGGDWCGVCWLTILELFSFENCLRRNFVFTVKLLKKRIKSIVANAKVTIAFFSICILSI